MFNLISAIKTTTKYYTRGKLVPGWDLNMHITRDILHARALTTLPQTQEENIDEIDFDKIHDLLAAKQIPPSVFPIEKGVHRHVEIPVNDVAIDPSWFDGIGVAEPMLKDLVKRDKDSGRVLNAEAFASWGAAEKHGIDKSSVPDSLLKIEPLADSESLILYFPGGGYFRGSPESHRGIIGRISAETQLRCVGINYRKAPKHPFPAQLHDALISLLYLVKQGFKLENIVLAGDSAGGHIVLTFLFLLRKIGMNKVRGAIALSPPADLEIKPSETVERNKKYDYLHVGPNEMPTSMLRMYYKPGARYTQEYIEELKDPYLAPVNGDFSDFPHTLIQVGEIEILADHSRKIYEPIKNANPDKTVVFEEIKDGIHVPHRFLFRPEAEKAYSAIGEFVKSI